MAGKQPGSLLRNHQEGGDPRLGGLTIVCHPLQCTAELIHFLPHFHIIIIWEKHPLSYCLPCWKLPGTVSFPWPFQNPQPLPKATEILQTFHRMGMMGFLDLEVTGRRTRRPSMTFPSPQIEGSYYCLSISPLLLRLQRFPLYKERLVTYWLWIYVNWCIVEDFDVQWIN